MMADTIDEINAELREAGAGDFLSEESPKTPASRQNAGDGKLDSARKGTSAITNGVAIRRGKKEVLRPLPIGQFVEQVRLLSNDELRRIGNSLFWHSPGHDVRWIDSTSSLFALLHSRCGGVRWHRGIGFVTKDEAFSELQAQVRQHDAIENVPRWPPIESHYYTCPIPPPGDGQALDELIEMHCWETDLDRELAKAMYASAVWGGPPGRRPAWLLTSKGGRGKGKTTGIQNHARVFGGHFDFSLNETIEVIKQRLLTPNARQTWLAHFDNVKKTRFSSAELENLITASEISGKQMYEGNASRPNFLLWLITLNGASLSTDMAQRVVEIRLGEPNYDAGWEERVHEFIDANRERIIADCIGFLQRPAKPMKRNGRWAAWESGVLSKVDHPDECFSLILDRRGDIDVEQEEGEIIEDHFSEKLAWLEYAPDREDVFIPGEIAARWYNAATGEQKKTTGVTRTLKQLHDEGRIHHLFPCRSSDRTTRGCRWIGENADATAATHYDIRERLASKAREQSEDKTGVDEGW